MTTWPCWILASAVFLAFYDLAKKASVHANAVLPVLLCSTIFGCAAFLLGVTASGRILALVEAIDSRTIGFSAIKSTIVATSWIFTFCALRTLPISIATPIRASAPALVFLLALFLYGETPSLLQALGMGTVFAGYFVFSWAGRHEGIDFLRNRAVWCAIGGMAFSALSAIWDKYLFQVRHLPVESVQFLFQIGLVVVYAVVWLAASAFRRLRARPQAGHRFVWRWTIPLVGILLTAADWLYFHGISGAGVPISVASLMRRFSVVITFVLGAKFFHETNLLRKGLSLAAILLGIVLLCAGAW
ncbi:MAG: EamA family transporter [Kiritimatiellia bacterium]